MSQMALDISGEHFPSVPLMYIEPDGVAVHEVDVRLVRALQGRMSRAIWRPSPGRNLAFLVTYQDDTLLGIGFLSSPVFNLGVRDRYLNLPAASQDKGDALRHYADLSVCVASQPIGWHWNLGKLIALVAPTLGDIWKRHYGDHLRGITTTSLYGKGAQYNRIYKFLGYTKGYGHEHVTDAEYAAMLAIVFGNPQARIDRPGTLTNGRMRVIQEYDRLEGTNVSVWHGQKRGVYYHPAVDPTCRQATVELWHSRWGLPRYSRTLHETPPYINGKDSA